MSGSPVLAVIGGTGLEKFISAGEYLSRNTVYGRVDYLLGLVSGSYIMFIPRHGFKHEYPPHKVPYKAIIDTIVAHGVDKVLAFSAVGSLRYDLKPGDIVIPTNLIDFSRHTETFYSFNAFHTDFTRPYCSDISRKIYISLRDSGIDIRYGYTYVSTYGPRFESSAEIDMYRMLGADIVGMTSIPESVLAREAGLHYSLISIVSNYAAGMQPIVTSEEVYETMSKVEDRLREILLKAVDILSGYSPRDGCSRFRDTYVESRGVDIDDH